MNPCIQDNTVSLKRTLEASGLRTECSKGGPKRRQPEWGGGGQDSVPQKDGGQRGLSVADGRATAGDCLRFGRLLYGRSPGLIPTHQHPRNPPARAQPFTNTFDNLREIHFTIGDKYILQIETNTFSSGLIPTQHPQNPPARTRPFTKRTRNLGTFSGLLSF